MTEVRRKIANWLYALSCWIEPPLKVTVTEDESGWLGKMMKFELEKNDGGEK